RLPRQRGGVAKLLGVIGEAQAHQHLPGPGYCGAWQVLVRLGLTDDTQKLGNAATLPWQALVAGRLPQPAAPAEAAAQLAAQLNLDPYGPELTRLAWLDIFTERPVGLADATAAQLLEQLLIEKWALGPHDHDQVVMQHQFGYELNGEARRRTASLVVTGREAPRTAMAQTVGLPLGMAVRRLVRGELAARGVVIPTTADFYEPILAELAAEYGIVFQEEDTAG
ncbi:MAG: saccharopine dehydrogenase, partial [Hymenobacter sp.]